MERGRRELSKICEAVLVDQEREESGRYGAERERSTDGDRDREERSSRGARDARSHQDPVVR